MHPSWAGLDSHKQSPAITHAPATGSHEYACDIAGARHGRVGQRRNASHESDSDKTHRDFKMMPPSGRATILSSVLMYALLFRRVTGVASPAHDTHTTADNVRALGNPPLNGHFAHCGMPFESLSKTWSQPMSEEAQAGQSFLTFDVDTSTNPQ
jgi:hypothetical protein